MADCAKKARLDGGVFQTSAELEAALPPLWQEDERVLQLQCATLAARANGWTPLAVIDDDPTGTQTAHSVPVLADWGVPMLEQVMTMERPCFYVLSNTRALQASDAIARAEEIARNLRAAAAQAGRGPLTAIVSRGDSCLRGHYPAETDALARGLGWGEGDVELPTVVIAPFFAEGGRLTAGDIHYVAGPPGSGQDGSRQLTPVGDTEFARDKAFSFSESNLLAWVAEKYTKGSRAAPAVGSVGLEEIRTGGPEAVARRVTSAPGGSVLIANSVVPRDMQVVALGCLKAELARGPKRPLLYRSAGALVAARAALPPRPLLTAAELLPGSAKPGGASVSAAGLIVVGSHVGKTTEQLNVLLQECPWLVTVELAVAAFASRDPDLERGIQEQQRVRQALTAALSAGSSVALFTSREVLQDDGAGGLLIGARVNDALCGIVEAVLSGDSPPSFLVAKGGITSNDVAVRSLGVKKAEVMGAIVPGVPVWRCGPESRAPGLAYVVFPGNVGTRDDLARVARKMSGRDQGDMK